MLCRVMRRALALVVVASAFVSCASGPTGNRRSAPPPIEVTKGRVVPLRFAWPANLSGSGVTVLTQSRARPEGTMLIETTSSCRFDVEPANEGQRVRTSGCEARVAAGKAAVPDWLQEFMSAAVALSPAVVVSEDGERVRVENVDAIAGKFDDLMTTAFAALPDRGAQLRTLLSPLFGPERIVASATQQWNESVGFWTGADLEEGKLYNGTFEHESPLQPGTTIATMVEFGIVGHRPCERGFETRECVQLKMTTYPDPAALKRAVEGAMGSIMAVTLPGTTARPVVTEIIASSHVTLLTESATLIPHELRVDKRKSGKMRLADGTVAAFEDGEARVSKYRYAP
ncbi:MAG TPA: hypothetical protein VFO62_03345 [Candidatus Binatia bacterium]|nr:hypothetical protein [Candidatus Binatia bacterium]